MNHSETPNDRFENMIGEESAELPSWSLTRRQLVALGTVFGGGLIIGCKPRRSGSDLSGGQEETLHQLSPFIHVTDKGAIVVYLPRVEMGQGTMTGIATLVAEELSVPPEQIDVRHAYVSPDFYNTSLPMATTIAKVGFEVATQVGLGLQLTGASTSMKWMYKPVRQAAAAVRELLVSSAMAKVKGSAWNEWEIRGQQMVRVNNASQSFALGDIAKTAAGLPLPNEPRMKSDASFRYIGKSGARRDVNSKTNGKAQYGADIRLPDMVYATVMHSPKLGGKLESFDESFTNGMSGEPHVFPIRNGLAIVANRTWSAFQIHQRYFDDRGNQLTKWTGGSDFDSDQLQLSQSNQNIKWTGLEVGFLAASDPKLLTEALINSEYDNAPKKLMSFYNVPFLPHQTMEPMNCTVRIAGGRCEVWVPTQFASGVRELARAMTGLPITKVDVYTTMIGGGFGRRIYLDFVAEAIEIALKMSKPVQLIWPRCEDMQNDFYRPAAGHFMRGTLETPSRKPRLWDHRITTQALYPHFVGDWAKDLLPHWTPDFLKGMTGRIAEGIYWYGIMKDEFATEGADSIPYSVGQFNFNYSQMQNPVKVGFYRSVGHSGNAFVVESFIDEMAHLASRNPVEFRTSLLAHAPRHTAVLKLAAEKSSFHQKFSAGAGIGVAVHACFGSFVAAVIEVEVVDGRVKVTKATMAVDCGKVINPDIVKAQVESSVIFGLSAAMKQKITFKNGMVQESGFHDCDALRIFETPEIDVHIVASPADPSGIGEPPVAPVAPALGNAIYAATKIRVKTLPIGPKL
jgi:isoquinoline 1-oxidoreductase beta subunit